MERSAFSTAELVIRGFNFNSGIAHPGIGRTSPRIPLRFIRATLLGLVVSAANPNGLAPTDDRDANAAPTTSVVAVFWQKKRAPEGALSLYLKLRIRLDGADPYPADRGQ